MIAMETEEGHDKIVEEVLRRLEENDLFVKPEKYMQKIREMGFLGVVIREDIPDREEESPRDSRVASTKECEGCVEVFGVGQLLQTVCQGFYKDSEAII